MSVIGFQEAYETTQIVTLSETPDLDVYVVTPQSLVLLKLTAWKDRCAQNTKDAQDLAFILLNYLDVGNNKRLYEEHQDWVENIDFDYEISGARLLGHDMAAIVSEPTKLIINQLLEIETGQQNQYKLAEAMTPERTRHSFEKNLALLEALYLGLNEPNENSNNS